MLIFLSGPVTPSNGHTIEENIAEGTRVYFNLLRRDIPAICPHLNAVFPEAKSISYDQWMSYTFELIKVCTLVIMLPRWEGSKGARLERHFALRYGKPVTDLASFSRTLGFDL